MEMIPVRSDAIAAIGYDPQTLRMRIRFTSGSTYTFCRVPPEVVERFMASSSKGQFYHSRIQGRYSC